MRFPEALSKDLTQESLTHRTDMVMDCYQQLLSHLDIKDTDHLNTVITNDYILINTRKVAKIQDFYVNSMAYAGVMVVKSEDSFQWTVDYGPLKMLEILCHGEVPEDLKNN